MFDKITSIAASIDSSIAVLVAVLVATLIVVANFVDDSAADSVADSVADTPPTIVYCYRKVIIRKIEYMISPPYDQLLNVDFRYKISDIKIEIDISKFSSCNRSCRRCKGSLPGCMNSSCFKKYTIDNAQVCIDDAKLKVQNFRDECELFKRSVLETLSYFYFLRMLHYSNLKNHSHSHPFKFSDFDSFFRKYMINYPASKQLKDSGGICRLYDEKDVMKYIQFPNSRKRIYPEFGKICRRNDVLTLSMSMKILHLLVPSNDKSQSRKNLLGLELHISKRILGRKLKL